MTDTEFLRVAGAVAEHLGDGWRTEPGTFADLVNLAHRDGRCLETRRHSRAPERMLIGEVFPPGPTPYGLTSRTITVRITRGPAVIAAEITRRLLPGYQESLDLVRRHQQQDAEGREALHSAVERLAERIQIPTKPGMSDSYQVDFYWNPGRPMVDGRVRIRLFDRGRHADLTIRGLSYETLERVVAAIQAGDQAGDQTHRREH